MDKLVELFNFLKESELMGTKDVEPFIAQMHLDNKDSMDIYFLRDLLGENVTKSQVHTAYATVFGCNMPSKFTYDKTATSTITKEEFFIAYDPAAYLNVRQWISYFMFEYGHFITRKDLFDWIMSTAKSRVLLGDIHVE